MKKLQKYLDRIGAEYTPQKYGANYFYNVDPLHFDGLCIVFDFESRPAITECKRRELIEKYCKRYGYKITLRAGYPGFSCFHVMKESEAEQLDFYHTFMSDSVNACEKYIHDWKVYGSSMTVKEQDQFLHGVMDFYGNELNQARAAMETETA